MRKQTRSILDEITDLVPKQDKDLLIEGLAIQAIARVINLVEMIQENYPQHQSEEYLMETMCGVAHGAVST